MRTEKINMSIRNLLILIWMFGQSGAFAQGIAENYYFGQKPPDLTPKKFAPGIISLDGHYEASITFSPDMSELFFARRKEGESHNIYTMKFIDGKWTSPELAFFSTVKKYLDLHPRFSPNGNRLYFGSVRPLPDTTTSTGFHQWYIEKEANTWSEPRPLLGELFDGEWVMCVSPASNGNLYFASKEQGEKLEDEGIYYAVNENGHYASILRMGKEINGFGKWISHPFVAPDESYVIYDAERSTGKENGDLYVSFNQNGTWTESYSLGPEINTELGQGTATVSPDGKYLFFSSASKEDGTYDLYWVSTAILDKFR